MSAIACKRSPKITPISRGKAFAPQFLNSSQKISIRKCFTLFAPADKLWLRCEVWAKHYHLEIAVISGNGGDMLTLLRIKFAKII